MADQAYRHQDTGVVLAVAAGSTLERIVTGSGKYEPAELEDLAVDVPALAAGVTSAAARDEVNGWLTPPGVPAAPITGAVAAPAAPPGDPLEDVLGGTTEEVNDYLDEHPDEVARVLELEAAGKQRKSILYGRHRPAEQPPAPPAEQPPAEQPPAPAGD